MITIPYYIQYAAPNDDGRYNNIFTTHEYCEKDKLHDEIIIFIINYMYEFCSEDCGHNIIINSYDDFCEKYWELHCIKMIYWENIFQIYYFENDKWIEWNIEDHKDEIYRLYLKII
jgi:hypothetical protein